MMRKHLLLTIVLVSAAFTTIASTPNYPTSRPIESIPTPPLGQRWVVNELFSDEFNDGKLDQTKWNDHHPSWIGRTPGLFEPKMVSFADGCLVLRGEKMKRDTIVHKYGKDNSFNISCAAVTSKTTSAHYGYYEARIKANRTTLSTTFWFSTRGSFDTEGRQPESVEKGRFGQELDVLECIGRRGKFDGNWFADGMNSNMHFWYTSDKSKKKEDVRARESRLYIRNAERPVDNFNTYGCWWRNADSVSFYLNNCAGEDRKLEQRKVIKGSEEIRPFKFTEPMGMNMVVEVYPAPWIEIPKDKELADKKRNGSYYDWVRSYILVSQDAEHDGIEMKMFEPHIHIVTDGQMLSIERGVLELNIAYTAPRDMKIELSLYDDKGSKLTSQQEIAKSGYTNGRYKIKSTKPKSGKIYCVVARLVDNGEELEGDSHLFIVSSKI